jgi:hypothetical protein
MASETFKKRQKETVRREKQKQKFARRMERKHEKAMGTSQVDKETLQIAQPVVRPGPTIL